MLPAKRFTRVPLLGGAAVLVAVLVAVLTAWLLSAVLEPKEAPAALPSPPAPADLPLGVPMSLLPTAPQPPGLPTLGEPTPGLPTPGQPTLGEPTLGLPTRGRSTLGTPTTLPTSGTRTTAPTRPAGRPSPTTKAPTTTPAQNSALTATLAVTSGWEDGYVAVLTVRNSGSTTVPWTGTVGNAGRLNVRLSSAWNATASQDGGTITLRGEPLAPGRTITAGYQVSAAAGSYPRPSACTLTGSTCRFA